MILAGSSCTLSCDTCQAKFMACNSTTTDQICTCGTQYINCLAANPHCSSNARYYYEQCKSSFPYCGCGNGNSTAPVALYQCSSNSYCDQNTALCTPIKSVGQSCESNDECGAANQNPLFADAFNCTNNVCTKITKY